MYNNGSCYIGELWNNSKIGHAYSLFANGLIFKGIYKDNFKVEGKVYDSTFNYVVYDGSWKHDCYHGNGKLVFEDGHTYQG